MVKLVNTKCPVCGAQLPIDPNLNHARCQYCGSYSRIENPRRPTQMVPPELQQLPVVIVPKHLPWLITAVWLIPVLLGALAAVVSVGVGIVQGTGILRGHDGPAAGSGVGTSSDAPSTVSGSLHWDSNKQPMLADVNGDGALDVLGWVSLQAESYRSGHLAAFDLVKGKELWVSPALGEHTYSMCAALVGDRLVVADETGTAHALSVSRGQQIWTSTIGERIERMCGSGAGELRIDRKDNQKLRINLATGQITPAGPVGRNEPCEGVATDEKRRGVSQRVYGRTDDGVVRPEFDGMSVDSVIADKASPIWVAIGTRSPGTRVPTAAGFTPLLPKKQGVVPSWMESVKAKPLWMSAVPTVNPLTVHEGAPETGAISGDRLFLPYRTNGANESLHLVAMDLRTGRNLWDVQVPASGTGSNDVETIVATERYVLAAVWLYLDVFDRASGAHHLRIGKW